jgi:hypothetical protein
VFVQDSVLVQAGVFVPDSVLVQAGAFVQACMFVNDKIKDDGSQ